MASPGTRRVNFFIDSVFPGRKVSTCKGCGSYLGYVKDWARNPGYCSLGCSLRTPLTAFPTRDRIIRTLSIEQGLSPLQLARAFGVSRSLINFILGYGD